MTGAAGTVGRAVTPLLSRRWDLQPTDVAPGAGSPLDVTDLEGCRAAFGGADAVIHLAADPRPDAPWETLLPTNVVGAQHVAQAAMDCGVRRLVFASSLQAMSGYPEGTQVRTADAPRPANLYGASKAWAEAIGCWIVAEASISVVALRIGWFFEQRPKSDDVPAPVLSSWLSTRDAAELVRAAVEADGIDFVVAHGISANRYRFAELEQTMERIGYRPTDDAFPDN